jgi:hypothetical protein
VEKPEGKRLLGRSRHRWVNNIELDLGERERLGWYGLDLFGSGLGPVEVSCECGNEPSDCIK